MRMILLGGIIATTAATVHGQFGIGGHGAYLSYLGDRPALAGTGINLSFGVDDQTFLRFSATYGIPDVRRTNTFALSSVTLDTIPPFVPVEVTSRLSTYHFWLDGQRFLGNGDYYWGGFYGILGLGISFARSDVTIGDYDRTRYETIRGSTASKGTWTLRGGFGYEADLGKVNLFLEGGANVSSNPADDQGAVVDLPTNFYATVGVRYWVKKGRSAVGRKAGAWKGAKKKRRKKTRGRRK